MQTVCNFNISQMRMNAENSMDTASRPVQTLWEATVVPVVRDSF